MLPENSRWSSQVLRKEGKIKTVQKEGLMTISLDRLQEFASVAVYEE